MIGNNRRQIRWRRLLLQNRCRVWDVREKRAVREKSVVRHKNDPRIWPPVASEISDRKRAALLQHQIQYDDFSSFFMKVVHSSILTVEDFNNLTLAFQVAPPDF